LSTGAFNFRKLGRVASVLIASLILAEAALAQSAAAPRPSPPIWIGNLSGASPGYIHAADILVGHARNIGADTIVMCGGKPAENLQITPDTSSTGTVSVRFSLPQIEPGFVDCRLRNGAQESLPSSRIQVMDIGGTLTELLTGNAMYQKVDVTDFGLDIEHATLRPIRNARIEVYEAGRVISVSDTDNNGEFVVAIPPDATDMIIRAVSRLRTVDLKVEDNTNASQFYYISSAEIDMRDRPARVSLVDRTRKSGAFNILEQIQRSNDFVHAADPQFQAFPFVIFWSERNQKQTGITSPKDGLIGTTFFSLTSSTAYILGDRNTDSDEYDDSVLIHEYAHMLAAKFSRDDSIGGAHRPGDNLDPRVAWSEGWANFFSAAVRNDSVYRDSSGPGGSNVLRFDLEDNYPPGSWTGYGSETSIQALLLPEVLNQMDGGKVSGVTLADGSFLVDRAQFVGKPIHRVDLSFREKLPIGGRRSLELIAEVFNVFNHKNYGSYTTTFSSGASFGQPSFNSSTAYAARSLQLGAHLTF